MNHRIELHCHLDGSVRPATVADLAARQGTSLSRPAAELVVAPRDCGDLMTYLRYLDPVLEVLQSPESLYRVARELMHDWLADDIGNGEVRFAPQLHGTRG